MLSRIVSVHLLLAILVMTGCAGREPAPVAPDAPPANFIVDEVHLMAIPVALNLDKRPGLDGFGVKVYLTTRTHAKPMEIRRGAVELVMYDGTETTNAPLCGWSYSASELPKYASKGSVGAGYQLAPRWGDKKPTQSSITVVARYRPPEGPAVQSAPSIIAIPSH